MRGRRNTGINSAASAASHIFDGSLGTEMDITLTADTAISSLANLIAGEIYFLTVTQDATGGWSLTLPVTVSGQSPGISLAPLVKTTLILVALSGTTAVLASSSATSGPVGIANAAVAGALKYGTLTKLTAAPATPMTLPDPTKGPGQFVGISVETATVVTVSPFAAETIDGAASYVTDGTQWYKAWFLSDGTNWRAFPPQ